MLFLLRFFLALLIAGQALLRWLHWNPRYSRMFVERRREPFPFAAKLIRGKVVEAETRLRPLQVEGVDFGAARNPQEHRVCPRRSAICCTSAVSPKTLYPASYSNPQDLTTLGARRKNLHASKTQLPTPH